MGNKRSVGADRSYQYVSVNVYDILTGLTTHYASITLAAKAIGCNRKSISRWLSKRTKTPFQKRYIITKVTPSK